MVKHTFKGGHSINTLPVAWRLPNWTLISGAQSFTAHFLQNKSQFVLHFKTGCVGYTILGFYSILGCTLKLFFDYYMSLKRGKRFVLLGVPMPGNTLMLQIGKWSGDMGIICHKTLVKTA